MTILTYFVKSYHFAKPSNHSVLLTVHQGMGREQVRVSLGRTQWLPPAGLLGDTVSGPGRKDSFLETCVPFPLTIRVPEQQTSGNWNFLTVSSWGKGKGGGLLPVKRVTGLLERDSTQFWYLIWPPCRQDRNQDRSMMSGTTPRLRTASLS